MKKNSKFWQYVLLFSVTSGFTLAENLEIRAQNLYQPINAPSNQKISDVLTDQDIPTGEGGFSRDYKIRLKAEDQVAIDVLSEDFDSRVMLIAGDGTTLAENDDGPDGSTNSLLFVRITEEEDYIVRVSAFGETGGGKFTLKITRLQPINNCLQPIKN